MEKPLVHVLVINWNGIQHLPECLDTLLASTYERIRVVLIDNASTDGSVAFARERYGRDPRFEVLECPSNLGWAGGNNAGIRAALDAGADYVFLLNNDTAAEPDCIERLVAAAEKNPRIGALAPKMLLYDNVALLNSVGLECSIIASSWDLGIGRLDGERWNQPRKVIGACGGAAFFRTAALRTAGLLPDDFEIYLDDLDLCLRIWDAGFEIWNCPAARIRHKFSATMGEEARARRKYYLNTRNRFRVLARNFPASKWPFAIAAFKVGEIRAVGRALLDGEPWRAGAHVSSWFDAAAYLPKAFAARRTHRPSGCFWPLIRTDCMFFRGTELPIDGWYRERLFGDLAVRPISASAHCRSRGGRLRLTLLNCYPDLGTASIEVRLNGAPIHVIETRNRAQSDLELDSGQVEFLARRIFYAEDTGELVDLGGWLVLDWH